MLLGAAIGTISTAVPAAASVPDSCTFTMALWIAYKERNKYYCSASWKQLTENELNFFGSWSADRNNWLGMGSRQVWLKSTKQKRIYIILTTDKLAGGGEINNLYAAREEKNFISIPEA